MGYKSTRRQWVKLWVNEWLDGTTRFELTYQQRLLWVDLLALAGRSRFPGLIYAGIGQDGKRIGYPTGYLAGILQMDEVTLNNAIKILHDHGHITLEESAPEQFIIGIINWEKYQSEYLRQKTYRKVTTKTTNRLPVEVEVEVEGEGEKSKEEAKPITPVPEPRLPLPKPEKRKKEKRAWSRSKFSSARSLDEFPTVGYNRSRPREDSRFTPNRQAEETYTRLRVEIQERGDRLPGSMTQPMSERWAELYETHGEELLVKAFWLWWDNEGTGLPEDFSRPVAMFLKDATGRIAEAAAKRKRKPYVSAFDNIPPMPKRVVDHSWELKYGQKK